MCVCVFPCICVCVCAPSIQDYPIRDCLCLGLLAEKFRPDLIEEVLSYLTPENMRYGPYQHLCAHLFRLDLTRLLLREEPYPSKSVYYVKME